MAEGDLGAARAGIAGGGVCQYCAAGRYKSDWGVEPCSSFDTATTSGVVASVRGSAAGRGTATAVTVPPPPTPKPNTHGNCKPGRYLLRYRHSGYCMTW
jgi:hypothetical protein